MSDNIKTSSLFATLLNPIHRCFFVKKRLSVLGNALSMFIPNQPIRGLDIGCGAGELTEIIAEKRPLIRLTGVDVLKRIHCESEKKFQYKNYDGKKLPFEDKSFEFSYLIDVLHHTDNPNALLAEAIRVTKHFILIKDHIAETRLDSWKLHMMDYVGNRSQQVYLPYHYLSKAEWENLFNNLHLKVEKKVEKLKIYNFLVSLFFGENLHFIAKLKVN